MQFLLRQLVWVTGVSPLMLSPSTEARQDVRDGDASNFSTFLWRYRLIKSNNRFLYPHLVEERWFYVRGALVCLCLVMAGRSV